MSLANQVSQLVWPGRGKCTYGAGPGDLCDPVLLRVLTACVPWGTSPLCALSPVLIWPLTVISDLLVICLGAGVVVEED